MYPLLIDDQSSMITTDFEFDLISLIKELIFQLFSVLVQCMCWKYRTEFTLREREREREKRERKEREKRETVSHTVIIRENWELNESRCVHFPPICSPVTVTLHGFI